jgi:alpha-N-arabinofuranosidase
MEKCKMRQNQLYIVFVLVILCSLAACSKTPLPVTEGESFTASVRVTDRVVNSVNPLIFGDNIEWVKNGMGFWIPEEKGFDSKLVEELRAAGVTHLRYPGGTLSDYFEWRKAVGENREPITNPFEKMQKEFPYFGPDEFMELCKKLNIPGTITFNAGTGTAQDAVAWFEYLQAKGFPVTAYAVGNELYMAKPEEPIAKTVQQYIDFYRECESGIRKIAPDVKLGAVSLHDARYMPIKQNHNWMEDILKAIGDKVDFIDVHNGYAPMLRGIGMDPDKLYPDDDFALCFMGASQYVKDSIEDVKSDLTKYAPNGGENIEIHITEYGPLVYPINQKRAFEDLAWNRYLAGAIYQACLFNVLLKEPRVASANHLPLCQDVFGALIGIRGNYPDRENWRNIVFYVFQMYSRMSGREVMDVEVNGPTYSTPSMGFVPNLTNVPYIDTGAYKKRDRSGISIFLINRDIKRSATVAIDPGIASFVVKSITTLTADSYKAENRPEKPDKTTPLTKPGPLDIQVKPFSLVLPKHSLTLIEIVKS